MVLPIAIGDYTDFFSSLHHAKNCGTIFRGPQNPIPPNWYVDFEKRMEHKFFFTCNFVFTSPGSLNITLCPGSTFQLHIMVELLQLLYLERTLLDPGPSLFIYCCF